jgi:hypothetical protein
MSGIILVWLIPVGALALLVIVLAAVAAGKRNGGDDMIRNVYMYVVLFATLMMTIGGSVGVVMNFADMVSPPAHWQTFEDYTRMFAVDNPDNEGREQEPLSQDELRERYDTMVLSYREMQVDRARNNMIKSFAWIIVPLPVFLSFRRMIEKQQRTE